MAVQLGPVQSALTTRHFDAHQLTRALTVLSQASGRHDHLDTAMADLLRADPAQALPSAITVATTIADGVDDGTLVRVLTGLNLDKAPAPGGATDYRASLGEGSAWIHRRNEA